MSDHRSQTERQKFPNDGTPLNSVEKARDFGIGEQIDETYLLSWIRYIKMRRVTIASATSRFLIFLFLVHGVGAVPIHHPPADVGTTAGTILLDGVFQKLPGLVLALFLGFGASKSLTNRRQDGKFQWPIWVFMAILLGLASFASRDANGGVER
jgi:hypothetical protein